jgi:hypothetical protein
MVFSTVGFARVFPEKRLELKSLKGQTKAEEEGPPGPLLLAQNRGTEGAPRGDGPSLKTKYRIRFETRSIRFEKRKIRQQVYYFKIFT